MKPSDSFCFQCRDLLQYLYICLILFCKGLGHILLRTRVSS